MEVRPGYKLTEVGVIPEDWDVKPFGEIFEYLPTGTNPRSDLSTEGDAYYIHYGDIHTTFNSHLEFGRHQPPRIARQLCKNAALLKNGDWIVADASEDFDGVGKSVEVCGLGEGIAAVPGLHTFLLRERKPTFVPGFKGHLGNLTSLHQQLLRLMTGMKVFGVSKSALKSVLLPIPKPEEQQAIAQALSHADAFIASLEHLIAKKRQLKQGAMQELLTGKMRLPGFTREWVKCKMVDYFIPVTTRNEELNDNVVTISAQQGFVRQEEFFTKRVASTVLSNYYLLNRGHFAYNRSYSNGYPYGAIKCLTKYEKAVVTTLYICFRPKDTTTLCAPFFEQYFEAGMLNAGLATVANEGGRAHGLLNVTKADFFSRPVQVPHFDEQKAIAEVLTDMDAEIAALETKHDKARRLKHGMMHDLLTGRIRLV